MKKVFLYWDEPDALSGSKRDELIGKVLDRHRSVAPLKKPKATKPKWQKTHDPFDNNPVL